MFDFKYIDMLDLNQAFIELSSSTAKFIIMAKPGFLASINSIGKFLVYLRDEVLVYIISFILSFIK